MRRGKHTRTNGAKSVSVKALLICIACTLVMCSIVGSTVAWLFTKTETVVNTFTHGDINITLEETDTNDGDDNPTTNTYNMIPGKTIAKDPKVTVLAGSEDSWLFVKLEKSTDPKFDDFMTYDMAEGWTALEGVDGVYYRTVDKPANNVEFQVIKDNTVTVKDSVNKAQLDALTADPTLTVTAYAVQRDAAIEAIDSALEAWNLVKDQK